MQGGRIMQPIAHGIDLVEVIRIGSMIESHGETFLKRCFTTDELEYAGDRRRRDEHLAARFAAKEAVLKALGTGLTNGIHWTDIEVRRAPDGAPSLALNGRAADVARGQGIDEWLISLSHTDSHAIASVIALGRIGDATVAEH